MMNKVLIGVLIVILLGSAVFFITDMRKNASPDAMTPQQTSPEPTQATSSDTMEEKSADKNAVKTFTVDGENFSFSTKEIKVKQGDRVKVVFNNKEGFHDWVLDEFNVKTKQIAAGASETVEFVADKKGTFEYYCSVGANRANGMVGKFIVE